MMCKRFYVSGTVQGVWYRAHTQEQAVRLGLTGWAKNLPDGRVEVLACGSETSLEKLEKSLREGSSLSKVTYLEIEADTPNQNFSAFEIL